MMMDIDNEQKHTNGLRACPFCGSKKILLRGSHEEGYILMCMNCRGSGARHSSPVDARAAWNRREEPQG
jgi:hypothetical protein